MFLPINHILRLKSSDTENCDYMFVKIASFTMIYSYHLLVGKVCYQLTGSSDFTLKSLLPVNWQQRIYVKIAATS